MSLLQKKRAGYTALVLAILGIVIPITVMGIAAALSRLGDAVVLVCAVLVGACELAAILLAVANWRDWASKAATVVASLVLLVCVASYLGFEYAAGTSARATSKMFQDAVQIENADAQQ